MKRRLARWLRRIADLIDRDSGPKPLSASFTFEPGGMTFHPPGSRPKPGCPLWYFDDEYMRAHTESLDRLAWIDPSTGHWRGVAKP
jgi:hypothetical protein